MRLIALLAVCLLVNTLNTADAQIFRRGLLRNAPVSDCPGGVCPTDGIIYSQAVERTGPFRTYRASSYGAAVQAPIQSYGSTGSAVATVITPTVTYGSSAVTVVAQPAGVTFVPAPAEMFSEVVIGTGFKAEVTRAIVGARKSGAIAPREALRLRVAMLSPAFAKNAEELALIQMTSSGENPDAIPMNPDGTVNAAGINWEGLAKFLEKFIPLLLAMLKALGLGG